MAPKVSVIIPVKEVNDYLRQETVPALLKQTYRNFEIIILPDKKTKEKFRRTKIIPSWPKTGPADKRDLGAKKARGEILAFLDDDSYPQKSWLKKALAVFKANDQAAAVCGPGLTPPHNNLRQKASGYVWSSWWGSSGAGTYRATVGCQREVDDYPSVNLLVRKKDFLKVEGFSSRFWPGEDTKLCLDLVYKLKKKIIYDPRVVVYHHRREVFLPHLKQIGRYALHRGHFARILPQTSLRIGYFIPTFFVLGLLGGFFLSFLHPIFKLVYLVVLGVYGGGLFLTARQIYQKERNIKLAFLAILSIFTTHVVYGTLFVKGFLTPRLER